MYSQNSWSWGYKTNTNNYEPYGKIGREVGNTITVKHNQINLFFFKQCNFYSIDICTSYKIIK